MRSPASAAAPAESSGGAGLPPVLAEGFVRVVFDSGVGGEESGWSGLVGLGVDDIDRTSGKWNDADRQQISG
jgi:hypothetical protein